MTDELWKNLSAILTSFALVVGAFGAVYISWIGYRLKLQGTEIKETVDKATEVVEKVAKKSEESDAVLEAVQSILKQNEKSSVHRKD